MMRDSFLVIRIRAGDEKAFGQLYDRYFKDIYRFTYFKVGGIEVAEDIASDVFFKIWQYIRQGSKVHNVRALLYQAARHKIIDYYRKNQEEPLESVEHLPSLQSGLEEQTERAEDLEKLYARLQSLKEEHKEVIVLRYVQELSHKEIGAIIGKTSGAVRVLLHRAMDELKKAFGNKL